MKFWRFRFIWESYPAWARPWCFAPCLYKTFSSHTTAKNWTSVFRFPSISSTQFSVSGTRASDLWFIAGGQTSNTENICKPWESWELMLRLKWALFFWGSVYEIIKFMDFRCYWMRGRPCFKCLLEKLTFFSLHGSLSCSLDINTIILFYINWPVIKRLYK
jgi:hypothetical protein